MSTVGPRTVASISARSHSGLSGRRRRWHGDRDGRDFRARMTEQTDTRVVSNSESPSWLRAALGDRDRGQPADAFSRLDVGGCYDADTILADEISAGH